MRVAEYKEKFPNSYTSMDEIEKTLRERQYDPVGQVFGISVSAEWLDRCFGFEVDKVTPDSVYFQYLGIWKC